MPLWIIFAWRVTWNYAYKPFEMQANVNKLKFRGGKIVKFNFQVSCTKSWPKLCLWISGCLGDASVFAKKKSKCKFFLLICLGGKGGKPHLWYNRATLFNHSQPHNNYFSFLFVLIILMLIFYHKFKISTWEIEVVSKVVKVNVSFIRAVF